MPSPGLDAGRFLILIAGRGPALPGRPRCPRVRAEALDLAFQSGVPRPQLQHGGVCTHLAVCPRAGMSKSRGQMPAPLEPAAASGRQRGLGGLLTGRTRALLAWLLFQASSPSAHSTRAAHSSEEVTRRRPWSLIGRGGSFPAHFPLPFSTSVPLSAGASSFLPGVTPVPHARRSPCALQIPCAARPSVTGRVRRAEPL